MRPRYLTYAICLFRFLFNLVIYFAVTEMCLHQQKIYARYNSRLKNHEYWPCSRIGANVRIGIVSLLHGD